ncbi:PEP-CTERM sorting domain-containing protein [Mastigocoleus testarum]|uniref:PEP-CTERM sorting domain-containing protein n=1 Tax=Mastigocoleus testarum TaxID=996925 RepID=UPI000409BD8C|nr:PEP-CTERM sorting domain-containing protein [Mastigocoleus testarum]
MKNIKFLSVKTVNTSVKNVLKSKIFTHSIFAIASISTIIGSGSAQAYETFFGEDLGLGEGTRLSSTPNADTTKDEFLSNLVGVGTETFESFAPGSLPPIPISFPGAGTATLQGSGTIENVPTGTNGFGRYPISGNQFFEVGTGNFAIDFSDPVAAFGFYGIDIGDFNGQVTLTLASGATQSLTVPNTVNTAGGSVLYYGLIAENSNEAFTRIDFGNTSLGTDVFGFDDFTIGSLQQVKPPTKSVPEPTTILGLLAVGGFGLRSSIKRNSKSKFSAKSAKLNLPKFKYFT